MDKKEIHNTKCEIKYLMTIGSEHLATQKIPRYEMIARYMNACQKRENWDGMDKARVLKFAASLK